MLTSAIRGAAAGFVFNLLMLYVTWLSGHQLPWPRTLIEWVAYAWSFAGCAIVGVILFVTNHARCCAR